MYEVSAECVLSKWCKVGLWLGFAVEGERSYNFNGENHLIKLNIMLVGFTIPFTMSLDFRILTICLVRF